MFPQYVSHDSTNHVQVGEWNDIFQLLARLAVDDALKDQVDAAGYILFKQLLKVFLFGLRLPLINPFLPEGHVAEVLGVDVDHTTARDSSWRGIL